MSRWIATAETLFDHPVVGMYVPPPPPAAASKHAIAPMVAWQDLIRSAAWKPHSVHHKGKVVALKRGELFAARSYWAARWNWGEQSVRTFFAKLVENEMVKISNQSKGHVSNVASVCNFEKYQSERRDPKPEQKPEPNQSLTSGQPDNTKTTTTTKEVVVVTGEVNADQKMVDPAPTTAVDWRSLQAILTGAAGNALEAECNAPGLADVSAPLRWIKNGYSLELDVLPAIRAVAAQKRRKPIGSWQYFEQAVVQAKVERERPMAAPKFVPVQKPAWAKAGEEVPFKPDPRTKTHVKPRLEAPNA